LDDFAHEMAILSLWLAEHQMNRVFDEMLEGYGASKPILPLKEAGKIAQSNAARVSWEEVCPRLKDGEIYIIGNPPYLGSRTKMKSKRMICCSFLKKIIKAWIMSQYGFIRPPSP